MPHGPARGVRRLGWVLTLVSAAVLLTAWGRQPPRPVPPPVPAGPLAGRVIVIDPGHGGPDPGAVGKSGTLEKDVVLAIARRLGELLRADGARVLLTRTGDTDLSGQAGGSGGRMSKRADLDARIDVARRAGAVLLVSIHANKFPDGRWSGAQVFFDPEGLPEGQRLAALLMDELRRLTPTKREVLRISQRVLRLSPVPAATVEVGFLSNPGEEARLGDAGYQHVLARAIHQGIRRYLAGEQPVRRPTYHGSASGA